MLHPNETGDREQGTSCPFSGHMSTDSPKARRQEEGSGQEEEEEEDEEEEEEVRTHSPHWLPGPIWVDLNGPEQR